jgi:hypothetical protein
MLIRSQDKKSLINMDNVTDLSVVSDSEIMACYTTDQGYQRIGKYSDESKAIKVLDMIQMANFRVEKMKMIYSHSGHLSNSCIQDFTFQMPQDEEV